MTTDLTGDFELGEDEFDWDVFVPDPNAAEIAAEAAALQNEDELNLDDSDFDWDAALRDDPDMDDGGEGAARSGAAYDRIVDTVRRSFEEPELDAQDDKEHAAIPATGAALASVFEPEQTESTTALLGAPGSGADTDLDAEAEPEEWLTLEEEPGIATAFAVEAEAQPDALFVTEERLEPGAAPFEPGPEPEWEPERAPAEARLAAMAATLAVVETVESTPIEPFEIEPAPVSDVAAQWDEGGATALDESIPIDAPTRKSRRHRRAEKDDRSRVLTATFVLASLVLVVIAVVAVVYALHHRTPATTTAPPPPHAAPAVPPTAATARIQSATDAIDSATTSASVGLSSLVTFPTPANVEKIINPYISSLQLYGTLLSGSNVPAAARSEASSAAAQVRQDLTFLDTIDALPPVQLGAYLKQFDADATQLQTTLSALEQNLRTQAS
jgi:hypothetical protein